MCVLLSVVSICATSNSLSNIVYIDSSAVPIYTNITCFSTIDVSEKVKITAMLLEYSDQLQSSFENGPFTNPFLIANSHVFGTGVVVLRYTTFGQTLTSFCLRLEGNNMQVSCTKIIYRPTIQ